MTMDAQWMERLRAAPARWLVTGAAGFIGSHLVETLLRLGQTVRGLDNFATGKPANLAHARQSLTPEEWARFEFLEGDLREAGVCQAACRGMDLVLHQAALGSVPRSLAEPAVSHAVNVTGTVNLLLAAREAGVRRVVYASSSAVYGGHPGLPKVEEAIGLPLSPYAATKWMNEIYAGVFHRCYEMATVGLRYFNVFGPRQDPEGPYAAVIPRWLAAMAQGQAVVIYGDGLTSRDFCPVANVVQANLLAATTDNPAAMGAVFNVALGGQTTLNELHARLKAALEQVRPALRIPPPEYQDFRPGDVRHSLADIRRARAVLGYQPVQDLAGGLAAAMDWYLTALAPGPR